MDTIRTVDDRYAFDTGYRGHRAQIISNCESAAFFASSVAAGGCAAGLHYHRHDQFYFLYEGGMTVRLGDDHFDICSESFVYIPAGVAHCNWNDTSQSEFHLEVIIPALPPGAPIAIPVDSASDVAVEHQAKSRPYIEQVNPERFAVLSSGVTGLRFGDAESNIESADFYYLETGPGSGRQYLHMHDFDQYYFVLSGELTVDLGRRRDIAGPQSVVIVPAGVPHRVMNAGLGLERHLAVDVPRPALNEEWEYVVRLEVDHADHVAAP